MVFSLWKLVENKQHVITNLFKINLLAERWIILLTILSSKLKLRICSFNQNVGSMHVGILPVIFTAMSPVFRVTVAL